MQQKEVTDAIQIKHQKRILQLEHKKALEDKNNLEILEINNFMIKQKRKQELMKEMQEQINTKNEILKQNTQSNNQEISHMLKHEFDLLALNEARHKEKISEMLAKMEMQR